MDALTSFFSLLVQPGRRRYRCDTDHLNYCSSLLERYQVPPAQEAVDDNDEDPNHDEVSTAEVTAAYLAAVLLFYSLEAFVLTFSPLTVSLVN